jgi:hypothetical protein
MPHLEPTYLRYIYDGLIKGSIHPENAAELPEGLIGLYEEAFDEKQPVHLRQHLLEHFAIWALLKKEVSAQFVAEVLNQPEEEIQEFITKYSAWFNSPESGKYQLYHERLKVYLLQKLSEGEVHVQHEKLISRLERAIEEQKADEFEWYGLEFLGVHLGVPGIKNGDVRLFKLGRNSDFESRQVEMSEGFEWTKSHYKKCIETASVHYKENVIEWGIKLHLINQKEQKDWTLIQRHFDAGDIDRFESELEEKINQFSSVSDNYLSYPILLIYAFYFRLIENDSIPRHQKENLYDLLNKRVEKQAIYLFDFPRLHLVIIERFYALGFDVSFLIQRFNLNMSKDDAQKCLFPSDFLSNGVYDNLVILFNEFDINEGDFYQSFVSLGLKYSTENLDALIERNGLINVDKAVLEHRIKGNLNPAYLIDILTKAVETDFDSFFSTEELPISNKNLYDLIEFALLNESYFNVIKWYQIALNYLRKSESFDNRVINLLNLVKDIPNHDLIQIGHKALNTGKDSRVSIFFGYLIKANKIDLIRIILEKTAEENANLVLWNFLLKNHFNLELFFESTFIESKEFKRIWLVNTIRYFRSQISSKKFLEFCTYSENTVVEIDQPEMYLDYWIPEGILTDDFNSQGGIRLNNNVNKLYTANNLEFILLLIAQSDVFDDEIEHFLGCRIKELTDRKITSLQYESVKSIFSFLLKYSPNHFNTHFDKLITYLNRLPTNEKYLNSLSFIYEMFEREGFKYQDIELTDYFYKHFSDSEIPRHPDAFGDLSKLLITEYQKKNIYISYVNYSWIKRRENITLLTTFNFFNDLLIESSLTVFESLTGELIAEVLNLPWDYCEFLSSIRNIEKFILVKIQNIINNLPGYPWEQLSKKEIINTYSKLYSSFNSKDALEYVIIESLMSSLRTSNEYEEFAFYNKLNSKNSQKKSIKKLKSPYFIDSGSFLYTDELCALLNKILDDGLDNFEELLPSNILKPLHHSLGVKTIQFIALSVFPHEKLNNLLNQYIHENIIKTIEYLFEYIKDTSTKSEVEEEDFEHSIEHLAESENIVLLIYCSLLIQISDKKYEKKVELMKKVIQELAKAGYYDFSADIDDYTEYEGDLIFLSSLLVNSYNPSLNNDNKILIYLPWRIKFIFIFKDLVKKEKSISFRTKKATIDYIDYCLSKNLSIYQLTDLYDSCMTMGAQNRANKIIKKILSHLEKGEDLYSNLYGILKACIHFKDKKNVERLINAQPNFFAGNLINNIQAQLLIDSYTLDDFKLIQVNLELDDRINTLIELAVKIDTNILKSQLLPILNLTLIECKSTDEELHDEYIVIIGCLLYQRFGFEYSKDFVFERSLNSVSTKTIFISELIIKYEIKEVDIFIRKARLKGEISAGGLLSSLMNIQSFQLDKMEKTILTFYKENSKECLEMIFSKRVNDLQTPVILSKLIYRKNEFQILIDHVEKLKFSTKDWIKIIKQQPSKLRPELLAKIISVKKSQITPNVLNLLQDSLSILISKKSIYEVISNYSDFKQWNRIERILRWLKKEKRLEEIHNLLELSFDNNWDLRLAVFVRSIGKEKTLKVLSGKTNFISGQAIESIDKLSEIPRIVAHVHPDYLELIRHSLDVDLNNSILESLKSRTTEAGYNNDDSFSYLYWTRMNVTEINRYVSIYFNNSEALELLVGNFKILSELDDSKEYIELLSQFDVNYAKYDVEL